MQARTRVKVGSSSLIVYRKLLMKSMNPVFLLWEVMQNKGQIIDRNRHFLESPHPSPFSAHRGFSANGHFKRANEYLQSKGKTPIDWGCPERNEM